MHPHSTPQVPRGKEKEWGLGHAANGPALLSLRGCPGAVVADLFTQVSVKLMKALCCARHSVSIPSLLFITFILPKLRHMKTLYLRAIIEEKRNSLNLYLRMILSCEKQTLYLTLVICYQSGPSLCANTATQKSILQ